jgi:hypothetical protein
VLDESLARTNWVCLVFGVCILLSRSQVNAGGDKPTAKLTPFEAKSLAQEAHQGRERADAPSPGCCESRARPRGSQTALDVTDDQPPRQPSRAASGPSRGPRAYQPAGVMKTRVLSSWPLSIRHPHLLGFPSYESDARSSLRSRYRVLASVTSAAGGRSKNATSGQFAESAGPLPNVATPLTRPIRSIRAKPHARAPR